MSTEASVTNGAQRQKIVFKCTTADSWPVAVSGDAPELGNWNPARALQMQPQARPQGGADWTAVAELPLGGTFEYKFIKKTDQGIRWESGFNRRHTVIAGAYAIADGFRE